MEDEALLLQIDTEKILRDLFVDFLEALIYNNLSAGKIIPSFIEQVYNTTHDAKGKACTESDFEFYDFVLWEMLICTVAVLLHYEQYTELNQILTHTYFLKESYFNTQVNSYTYDIFRKYFHTIEDVCKPKSDKPKCITFVGEIITRREKKPIITKASLANADVVLYQMFSVLALKDKERHDQYWYPLIYPYCSGRQPMWQMLKSKAYCGKSCH